jgi:hypothetical protein
MDKVFLGITYSSIVVLVTALALTTPKAHSVGAQDRPPLMQAMGR